MKIQFLYYEGCLSYKQAYQHLLEVLEEEKIEADIEKILVKSNEEAARLRMLGSPTVRVNGKDVEEGAENRTDYGVQCRHYEMTGSGILKRLPKEAIRKAVVHRM